MEQELKYALPDPEIAKTILQDNGLQGLKIEGTAACKRMEAKYYDFDDMSLNQAGITFRVRKENEAIVATLKRKSSYKDGLYQRDEWNEEVDQQKPDLSVFRSEEAAGLIGSVLRDTDITGSSRELECMVNTEFERNSFHIRYKSMTADVSVDVGNVTAGGKSVPICELEMELLEGDVEDMVEYGEKFSKEYNLKYEKKSKYARGLKLIECKG